MAHRTRSFSTWTANVKLFSKMIVSMYTPQELPRLFICDSFDFLQSDGCETVACGLVFPWLLMMLRICSHDICASPNMKFLHTFKIYHYIKLIFFFLFMFKALNTLDSSALPVVFVVYIFTCFFFWNLFWKMEVNVYVPEYHYFLYLLLPQAL